MRPAEIPSLRYAVHKACAHPLLIWWFIGTCLIWFPLSWTFSEYGAFASVLVDWTLLPLLILCYVVTSALGFFVGGVFVSWLVLWLCLKINGAPYEVGERVLILSGKYSGEEGVIGEITIGQDGAPVPRVDLRTEDKDDFEKLYDGYRLLRLSSKSKSCASSLNT